MDTKVNAPQISKIKHAMIKMLKITGIVLGIILLLIIILAIVIGISSHGRILLPVKHRLQFDAGIYTASGEPVNFPASLHVEGNRILAADGTAIRFHGLMPADPARLDAKGKFNRQFYDQIREAGANVIRISIQPDRWLEDEDYLWRHIDPIVGWAGQMNMYAIIDWHYIGDIETGAGAEMPDIDEEPFELTIDFWQKIATYFRTTPHVIFEIWNEPAGGINAETWQRYAAQIVHTIREQGASQLVIVSGVEYSRDLSWVLDNPIPDDNVAYTTHIYPGHSSMMWDDWFGEVSEKFPVLATEWGFIDEDRANAPVYLVGTAQGYGETILKYLDEHGIGWVACWYDDEWEPQMFSRGWKAPTNFGVFVLNRLKGGE